MSDDYASAGERAARILERMEGQFLSRKTRDDSVNLSPRQVENTIGSMLLAIGIPLYVANPQQPRPDLGAGMEKLSEAYPCFSLAEAEALGSLFRAYELALYGAYNASQSLLRGVVELIGNAALTDFLAHNLGQELERAPLWRPDFRNKVETHGLLSRLRELPLAASEYRKDPWKFFSEIVDAGLGEVTFRVVGPQLAEWGLLRPLKDPLGFIDYQDLCRNVHVEFSRTDLLKRLAALDSTPGTASANDPIDASALLKPLPLELRRASNRVQRVAELMGVIGTNLVVRVLGEPVLDPRIRATLSRATRKVGMTVLAQRLESFGQSQPPSKPWGVA